MLYRAFGVKTCPEKPTISTCISLHKVYKNTTLVYLLPESSYQRKRAVGQNMAQNTFSSNMNY
jgi:hypothetical protein